MMWMWMLLMMKQNLISNDVLVMIILVPVIM